MYYIANSLVTREANIECINDLLSVDIVFEQSVGCQLPGALGEFGIGASQRSDSDIAITLLSVLGVP